MARMARERAAGIGCSPKARLRASPQALEAVYEQERQSFLTVAIRQDAFDSGFQLSPTAWLGEKIRTSM